MDLNTLVDKTFLLLEKLVHDEKIDVEFSLDKELPTVRGDASMLKQVILNVVLNSIQAVKKKPWIYKSCHQPWTVQWQRLR